MRVSYDWLKEYLGVSAPTPQEIEELLTFHAFEIDEVEEVGDDTVIDVDVLPNRSSDCLCHRGIAREIATLTSKGLYNDPLAHTPELPTTDKISVAIENKQDCPRFTASLITGVEVKESPQWLKDRLEAIGQRSINNIVDATNYVMLAIGQPLHAYDADLFPQVDGKWQFSVRKAKAGETVSLLAEGGKDEDRVLELKGTELLIVDQSSNTPIGLAGVKGGRYAGVHAGTTKIIVEAAHFNPVLTRKTARGLGIVIDASKRFENEPSRELPLYAQADIATLIADIAGGTCEGVVDEYLETVVTPEVEVRTEKVNALLGLTLSQDDMISIVERLGAVVTKSVNGFSAVGPFERTDLLIEEDYIEEIGRIHGLTNITSVIPEPIKLTELNKRQYYSEQLRQLLLEKGFSEVVTSSFRKKDKIQLQNALASDKSFIRSSLIKNISETLDRNVSHIDLLGLVRVQVFEIGTVFMKTEDSVGEHVSLALGVRTKATGYTPKDDKPLYEAMEAIHQLLGVQLEWRVEQGVAETNLSAVLESLDTPKAYEPITQRSDGVFQAFSSYPAMSRDISLWTNEGTTIKEVETVLNETAGELRVRTTLFDEFTKDGRTSFAFRLVFQSYEKTLTDEEVNVIMDSVYEAVSKKDWEVR
ncbi:MAG: phenylalanine--tRNA ligase subunit beta [Patescibacteria group bacterium]